MDYHDICGERKRSYSTNSRIKAFVNPVLFLFGGLYEKKTE